MTSRELSQIEEKDLIYDKSEEIAYHVIKIYNSGILTYWEWTNSLGRFAENKFFKYEELIDENIILV